MNELRIIPFEGLPEIEAGADLPGLLLDALVRRDEQLADGDIVVVTHKVVSKAEGAVAELGADEETSYRRIVLDEAEEVLRRRGDLVIARTSHGFICANAGVDRSNAPARTVILLPTDPDRSAHGVRSALEAATGASIGVVVSDTFGRPWRRGLVDVAIGISGIESLLDLKGTRDAGGRELEVTEIAVADAVAAAADLVMGKAAAIPAALVRGLDLAGTGRAADLIRPASEDLFR